MTVQEKETRKLATTTPEGLMTTTRQAFSDKLAFPVGRGMAPKNLNSVSVGKKKHQPNRDQAIQLVSRIKMVQDAHGLKPIHALDVKWPTSRHAI